MQKKQRLAEKFQKETNACLLNIILQTKLVATMSKGRTTINNIETQHSDNTNSSSIFRRQISAKKQEKGQILLD